MVGTTSLDDTSRCPVAPRCAGCGSRTRLRVAVADTQLGTVCLTVCPACVRHHVLPTFTAVSAVRAVLAHCEHVGVDVEQAAALRAAERGTGRGAR